MNSSPLQDQQVSVCVCVYMSTCLCDYMCVCKSVCLNVFICLSVCLPLWFPSHFWKQGHSLHQVLISRLQWLAPGILLPLSPAYSSALVLQAAFCLLSHLLSPDSHSSPAGGSLKSSGCSPAVAKCRLHHRSRLKGRQSRPVVQ